MERVRLFSVRNRSNGLNPSAPSDPLPAMTNLDLDPVSTAVVLIDLQQGITGLTLAPHASADVVRRGRQLAEAFRERGATIVYVRVLMTEMANLPVDAPGRPPGAPPPPPAAMELVPEAGFRPGDLLVAKRQWGAFYGTDLDQHLRRRRITTIVLGGIATNIGVESTARAAHERAYELVLAEDAMTSLSADAHAFSIQTIFPRLGRVRTTEQIIAGIRR